MRLDDNPERILPGEWAGSGLLVTWLEPCLVAASKMAGR